MSTGNTNINGSANAKSNGDGANIDPNSLDTMITTIDNPWDPFTQFDEWYAFDIAKGYNTCSYLARLAPISDALSEEDNDLAISSAQDEIINLNIFGKYLKIKRGEFKKRF
jgi:hypothetical protein